MDNKPTATSYKRRMNDWDYTQPRIYMLTLATEGRQPLFGTLTGDPTLPATAPEGPHLQPTELGAVVLQEVDGIPRFYPQITIIARQLMPDHLHILLYVRQALPVHIGQVVAGFKAGCNRRWRELGCPQMPQRPQQYPVRCRSPARHRRYLVRWLAVLPPEKTPASSGSKATTTASSPTKASCSASSITSSTTPAVASSSATTPTGSAPGRLQPQAPPFTPWVTYSCYKPPAAAQYASPTTSPTNNARASSRTC